MKFVVAFVLLSALVILVRRRMLRVDHSFPLFGAIVILGFAAINDKFIDVIAASLGIVYAPLAIILIAIFIVLALVTLLASIVSRLRHNQVALVRRFAEIDLDAQENRLQNTE
jgi:hypothetical protein